MAILHFKAQILWMDLCRSRFGVLVTPNVALPSVQNSLLEPLGLLISLPTGTFTLKDTPSFPRRDNEEVRGSHGLHRLE